LDAVALPLGGLIRTRRTKNGARQESGKTKHEFGEEGCREKEGWMTKADLIEKLAEKAPQLSRRQAELVVNTIFDSIRDSLKRGEKTEIRGFGSFRLRHRQTKEGRNPKTGESVSVPEKRMPFFKAGKEIKELLNPNETSV
jgi:integration host factor subunit beta